jgi:hypothetical protein
MADIQQKFPSISWAWAAGWFIASLGQSLSDVYSNPNRGLAAYYVLGFAGWAIGATGTIRYMTQKFRVDGNVSVLSAAGWGFGALASLVLGLSWAYTWNLGFLGLPLGVALGGAIGGALALPMRSLSSPLHVVLRGVLGALTWGGSFLVFQVLAFYAGYFLMALTVNGLAPIIGWTWAKAPGWAIPAGIGGFLAAQIASKLLYNIKVEETSRSQGHIEMIDENHD